MQNGNTAENNDSDYEQLRRGGHSRREICLIAIDIAAAVNETVVGISKFLSLYTFVGKRLDYADAGERIFHLRVDIADAFMVNPSRGPHALIEVSDIHNDDRQKEKNDQGKLDIDRKHDDKRANKVQH